MVSTFQAEDTLKAACGLDIEPLSTCLLALGKNLDDTELTRKLFDSRVSRQGAEALLGGLLELFPPICRAFDGASLNASSLLAAVPSLLKAYKRLDIVVLEQIYPEVHDVMETCAEELAGLANDVSLAVDAADPVESVLSLACKRVAGDPCLVKLSGGLDAVTFVRGKPSRASVILALVSMCLYAFIEQVGTGALAAVVERALPEACKMVHNAAGELSIENLLWHVEDLLNLLGSLHEQQVLTRYIPAPPSPECRRQIHAIPAGLGLENLCTTWIEDGTLECLKNLSDSIDRVGLLRDMMGSRFLRRFIEEDLTNACALVMGYASEGISVEVVAAGIDWYIDLYTTLPAFLQGFLPAFPLQSCPQHVSISKYIQIGVIHNRTGGF